MRWILIIHSHDKLPKLQQILSPKNIHQYAIQKGETDCDCVDPLIPQDGGSSIWMDTHVWNTGKANDARYVDVVFLGDSITERWHETEYGKPESSALGSTSVFESLFSKRKGTKYDGLALGISGDTVGAPKPQLP